MKLRDWFLSLKPREQLLVATAALLLVLCMLFLAIWEPLGKGVTRLRTEVTEMRTLAGQLAAVQGTGRAAGGPVQGRELSLLTVVDQTSKQAGLATSIKRMQPEGATLVRVWVEQADYAVLVRWLAALESGYAVSASDAAISRESAPGLVRARIDLVRSGA